MTPEALIIQTLFRIADKDGSDVDFILNPVQAALDESLTGRDIIPKARQEGVSSYFLARYTAACLSRRNVRAVVISHDQESTQRMLMKVKYFLDNIKGPPPVLRNNSANEITFPKTGSMFYIGTAGARKFGRGDTITHLHCSEYAFWPAAHDLSTGLFQAVPMSGEIAIESTGNGMNDYAARCLRAQKGQSQYYLHFFNWQDFPEYTLQVGDEEAESILETLDPAMEEDKLSALTPGQIKWRRLKLEELNWDLRKFKQEYPMTLDECFQASGNSIFGKVLYAPSTSWRRIEDNRHGWLLDGHPDPGYTYVLGADVAAGVEKDSSAMEVFCLDTMEQVAEYDNNKIAPDDFAGVVCKWGHWFNEAYIVVEQNNHGLVTLAYIRDLHYPNALVYSTRTAQAPGINRSIVKMGMRTTVRSKPLIIGNFRKRVADELVIHSELLMNQMTTFIEHEDGDLGAEKGCHDDLVIAAAEAAWGLPRAELIKGARAPRPPKPSDNFLLFDNILKEMQNRGNTLPVRAQHGFDITFRGKG